MEREIGKMSKLTFNCGTCKKELHPVPKSREFYDMKNRKNWGRPSYCDEHKGRRGSNIIINRGKDTVWQI